MLLPNNKQRTKLFQSAGVARWAYNWVIEQQELSYNLGGKFIQDNDLRKTLTMLKKGNKLSWLNEYSNEITKQAIKDACQAYGKFFKGLARKPKFKSKKKSKPSFYDDANNLVIKNGRVKITKIGYIKLAEKDRIPQGVKYYNPRITFDGLNWYISVGVEFEPKELEGNITEGVGVDLGVKELAIVSNGVVYPNVNKRKKVRKLEKKLKRLQRKASRGYEKLKNEGGESRYNKKGKNLKKLENDVKKVYKRLKDIRLNNLHQITSKLVRNKPDYVVIEDLNIRGMLKNLHLSKAIQQQMLYEFRRQIEYKCLWNIVSLIIVDRWYPSSKLCSRCGHKKHDLKLSDRIYICPECGLVMDRDMNAAINLREYPNKKVS